MINLKTTRELRYMRDAGKISQEALLKAGEAVRPGVSTLEWRFSGERLHFGK